jgi:hypothetical protein
MNWRDSASQSLGPSEIADIGLYVNATTRDESAPLDVFYAASQEILKVGTPAFLQQHPAMGPLLLVGIVSTTENYFRDLYSRIIQLCPRARSASADQALKLGSVLWHGSSDVERGAFEHISFASADNILSTTKKFIDYTFKLTKPIEEFDKVCELRHGIVHSNGMLAGKNAIKLQVPSRGSPLRIVVGFAELQEAAAICTGLVVSVNRDLFVELARRWANEWPRATGWNGDKSRATFKRLWGTFHSAIDLTKGSVPSPISMVKCRHLVTKDPFK